MKNRLSAILIYFLSIPTCLVSQSAYAEGWVDVAANGSLIVLKGKADTYNFVSLSPELRYRFKGNNSSGPFISFGSALINNLNQNPSKTTATEPSSISRSNIYVSTGWSWKISNSDLVPVIGVGYMNQKVNKDNDIYDKGGFLYFGFTASVFGW